MTRPGARPEEAGKTPGPDAPGASGGGQAMRRVLVIGCPGAGKSTFARALRDATGLPLYYLDRIWHRPDGTHVDREAFAARLTALLRQDRWILDGNYLHTLELRLAGCDTVFFLDYPLPVCLEGAAARVGKHREDMPWVETRFDPEFRQWIEDFPRTQRPAICALLARYAGEKQVIRFGGRDEAEAWLARQRGGQANAGKRNE